MKKILFIPIIIFLAILVMLGAFLLKPQEATSKKQVGRLFPSFQLPSAVNDREIVTEKLFEGHISVVNVFASWCIVCRAEHDMFLELLKKENVRIYGINWKDERSDLAAWLKELGNPYENIIYDYEGKLIVNLGITGIPETFIVDKNRKIIYHLAGALTEETINSEIIPMLQKELKK